MNAAFLLLTSAMMVGQAGDKKPAPPPAAPAPVAASSCGSSCDTCCDTFGHKLRDRMRGLFHRGCNTCDSCKPTCCEAKPVCAPKCEPTCDTGCHKKWFHWEPKCHTHSCCAAKPTCDTCESGFLSRMRHNFHRHDSCCDGGCGTAAPASAPAKSGEKIEAPKKMPAPPKTTGAPSRTQEVRIENPPAPSTIQVAPAAPVVEVTPVPAPRVEGDRRDPF